MGVLEATFAACLAVNTSAEHASSNGTKDSAVRRITLRVSLSLCFPVPCFGIGGGGISVSREPASPVRDMEPWDRGGWSRRSPCASPVMVHTRSNEVSPGCRRGRGMKGVGRVVLKRNTFLLLARSAVNTQRALNKSRCQLSDCDNIVVFVREDTSPVREPRCTFARRAEPNA